MQTIQVKLTIPKTLYDQGSRIVADFGYSNLQDLTLECLRREILELRKEQALVSLRKNFGASKPRPRLTKEQKEMIARRHGPKRAKEITKKYGLEAVRI